MPTTEKHTPSEEIVLNEDQLICILTNKIVKASEKESNLQFMIQTMSEEYGFALEDMQRDFSFKYTDEEDNEDSR